MGIVMELSYEKLSYQTDAVNSVIDTLSGHDEIAREIVLDPDSLDEAVRVTLSNSNKTYPGSEYLSPFPQFNIEMETGTGKTMVYLKTIMDLHRRFNENKFIIVVPSRAIKAGVEDSLLKMNSYLSDVHQTDRYHSFVYDSKQMAQLQAFEGSSFEIMLTTVQAFNKDSNVINQEYSEGFWGGKPIDQIRQANPVVIIDEPQSVDGGAAGKKAIADLNPKFVLRYSATHKDKQYPLLFEFGPSKAYKEGAVKQIETLGTDIDTDGNLISITLKAISLSNAGKLQAEIEAYVGTGDDYDKKVIKLGLNKSLAEKAKNPRYETLGKMTGADQREGYIEFEDGSRFEVAELDADNEFWVERQMTALIKDHLDRELKLQDAGIKVLSLIFLDSVSNYRRYDDGTVIPGKYAELFERLYNTIIHSNEKYKALADFSVPVSEVHDGYFAKDRQKGTKVEVYTDTKGDTAKDDSAYAAIMTDKEGLLTKYNPADETTDTKAAKLRFIFSHSALKEGWDNPNVFQILTIASPKNDLTRRQKIGRGLRISVNQSGDRVYGSHNVVTVYANESFEEFAEGLQREYRESGMLVNKISADFFKGTVVDTHEEEEPEVPQNLIEPESEDSRDDSERITELVTVTTEDSEKFVNLLSQQGYIKGDGTPKLKQVRKLKDPQVASELVTSFVEAGGDKKVAEALVNKTKLEFTVQEPTNRADRTEVQLTDKNNEYFKDLWKKISKKVKYQVKFSERDLIDRVVNGDNSIKDIRVTPMKATQIRARMNMNNKGVTGTQVSQRTDDLPWENMPVLDVSRQIADSVGLTRKAVNEIIIEAATNNSEFINKIKMNPAIFVRRAVNNILVHERTLVNDSLVYVQTGEVWPLDDLQPFDASKTSLWQVPDEGFQKTLFEQIATQSREEDKFAQQLVMEEKIKYFLKLPNWFKIPTPFGNYNPDWAILAETDDSSRLYFVVDTKTTREMGDLRPEEQDRLKAGRRSYEAIEGVQFDAPVKVIADIDLN